MYIHNEDDMLKYDDSKSHKINSVGTLEKQNFNNYELN